ncbi:MAG: hypothetical protein A2V65_12390 [Deltaproteobacteria bacterium RBG_13_49_15]|nr:MAG: hypothetical protein A2V65_12390 [Deltaproteobacteria bacterium RBG_13_49_15]
MADLIPFSYRNNHTLLHRYDVRCKMLSFIALSLTTLKAEAFGLLLISCIVITALSFLKGRILVIFYELRFFIFFLFFVFIIRTFSTPGSPVFQNPWIPATREGIYQGGCLFWKMLLIALLSLVFISTTKPSQTKEALKRFFRPIPFVPEERLAAMITLMIRFIPLILDEIQEIKDAQRSRCIENRKNPFYRIKHLTIPLFRGLFETAGELAEAMESRCFGEGSTPMMLSSGTIDWFCLAMVLVGCLLIILS